MSHLRKVIRGAVVTLLRDGNTLAGDRVLDTAYKPRVRFPALVVLCLAEDQQVMGLGDTERLVDRTMHLDVHAEVQQAANAEDVRDDLLAQAEALIATVATSGVIPGVRDIVPVGLRIEEFHEGEKPITVGRQRFAVTYFTTTGDPSAAA